MIIYMFEFIWLLLCHQEHLSTLTSVFFTRKVFEAVALLSDVVKNFVIIAG